jgi:AraC family transcriptional regulator
MAVHPDRAYDSHRRFEPAQRAPVAVASAPVLMPARPDARALHLEVVERVILTMRERLGEPLPLRELAEVASFSPFHFDRLFRRVTGLPPGRFLTMLRMEAARRMLLTTGRSITDIGLDVGYNSIGTFTYQFTQIVGLSPGRMRRLAARAMTSWEPLIDAALDGRPIVPFGPGVTGRIEVVDDLPGAVFVGLFQKPLPEGRPLGCTVMSTTGPYRVAATRPGRSYIFAASFPWSNDPVTYLLPDAAAVRVATSPVPIDLDADRPHLSVNLVLRPLRTIDPPLLATLPLLLAERCELRGVS